MFYYLDEHYCNQNDHKAGNIVHEVVTKGGQAAVWVDLHGCLRNMRVCKMVQQTQHSKLNFLANRTRNATNQIKAD